MSTEALTRAVPNAFRDGWGDCVAHEVNQLEGIVYVTFELSDRTATVVYDTSLADVREIVAAIDRANDPMRPQDDAGRALG